MNIQLVVEVGLSYRLIILFAAQEMLRVNVRNGVIHSRRWLLNPTRSSLELPPKSANAEFVKLHINIINTLLTIAFKLVLQLYKSYTYRNK